MPNPRLLAIITAFLIAGGASGANAAYTFAQLQNVERLILSKDCGALLEYLTLNSEMMDGDDLLAQELRNFAQGVQGGLIECLSVIPGQILGVSPDDVAAY
ncbi:MAG: hypothetical protein V3U96_02210 [Paracoccaceae bacterium]